MTVRCNTAHTAVMRGFTCYVLAGIARMTFARIHFLDSAEIILGRSRRRKSATTMCRSPALEERVLIVQIAIFPRRSGKYFKCKKFSKIGFFLLFCGHLTIRPITSRKKG